MRTALLLSALAVLAASAAFAGSRSSAEARRGRAFAEAHCATCHAIGRNAEQSPNPSAPPFELVANERGLTRQTLTTFLRDAHNYPDAMQFTLDRRSIDSLVSYMLTLRRRGYHPPI